MAAQPMRTQLPVVVVLAVASLAPPHPVVHTLVSSVPSRLAVLSHCEVRQFQMEVACPSSLSSAEVHGRRAEEVKQTGQMKDIRNRRLQALLDLSLMRLHLEEGYCH